MKALIEEISYSISVFNERFVNQSDAIVFNWCIDNIYINVKCEV